MNILHVVHAYTPSVGGSQVLIQRVSEELVQQYGHQVRVLTSTALTMEHFTDPRVAGLPPGEEEINQVSVRRLAVQNQLGPLWRILAGVAYRMRLPGNDWLRTAENGPWLRGLAQAIRVSQADVVLAATFPLKHMYDTLAATRRIGKPIVLLGALHLADRWGYDRPMIYRAIRAADAYIALSGHERDVLVDQHHVPSERVHVIGGGVDLAEFATANGNIARQRHALGPGPIILSLGKHSERKRFDLLLAAMPSVWREFPTAQLVIAGAQTQHTAQLRQLAHVHATGNIHVLADLSNSERADLLAACDVFALASGDESFGIVFAEAWANYKPVIGARRGAISSIITDGQDGLLFDFPNPHDLAQRLLQLLRDTPLAQRLGQAGHANVLRQYTWPKIAQQYHALYTSLTKLNRAS